LHRDLRPDRGGGAWAGAAGPKLRRPSPGGRRSGMAPAGGGKDGGAHRRPPPEAVSTTAGISGRPRPPRFAPPPSLARGPGALQLVLLYWAGTTETLLDTDDAMRLVEVRAFLAGQGWFDMTELRVAPPLGYETHWSRLIDAGLAALFLLGRWFADPAMAERL